MDGEVFRVLEHYGDQGSEQYGQDVGWFGNSSAPCNCQASERFIVYANVENECVPA